MDTSANYEYHTLALRLADVQAAILNHINQGRIISAAAKARYAIKVQANLIAWASRD